MSNSIGKKAGRREDGDKLAGKRIAAGRFVAERERSKIGKARFEAVMQAAERSGLLRQKSSRIGGRVSPALVEQAKKQTGIETDTDLIEFALASVALEDEFAQAFKASRGKVDPDLKLGF
ncbi:MAG: hypothetical protein ACHQAQ_01470 [Hyphomicrobiales bacterium]